MKKERDSHIYEMEYNRPELELHHEMATQSEVLISSSEMSEEGSEGGGGGRALRGRGSTRRRSSHSRALP